MGLTERQQTLLDSVNGLFEDRGVDPKRKIEGEYGELSFWRGWEKKVSRIPDDRIPERIDIAANNLFAYFMGLQACPSWFPQGVNQTVGVDVEAVIRLFNGEDIGSAESDGVSLNVGVWQAPSFEELERAKTLANGLGITTNDAVEAVRALDDAGEDQEAIYEALKETNRKTGLQREFLTRLQMRWERERKWKARKAWFSERYNEAPFWLWTLLLFVLMIWSFTQIK